MTSSNTLCTCGFESSSQSCANEWCNRWDSLLCCPSNFHQWLITLALFSHKTLFLWKKPFIFWETYPIYYAFFMPLEKEKCIYYHTEKQNLVNIVSWDVLETSVLLPALANSSHTKYLCPNSSSSKLQQH